MERHSLRIAVACVFSTLAGTVSVAPIAVAQAAEITKDGTIILNRTVQPRIATRPTMVPDPNPITVNPNIAPQMRGMMDSTELSDGEFAQVTTGSSLNRHMLPGGALPGMSNATGNLQGMPGVGGGSAPGAAGSSISNQVNSAVKQGLVPLQILTEGR